MLVFAKVSELIYECPTYTKWKTNRSIEISLENCTNPCKKCYKSLNCTDIPGIVVDIEEVQNIINKEIIIFLQKFFKNNSDILTNLEYYFYSWDCSKIENNKVSTAVVWHRNIQVKEE